MADGSEGCEKRVLKLNLVVDIEKNKVVFVGAGNDFVNLLFSFVALPMGTIVRFLEKYKQNQTWSTIGCFSNLYKSVSGLSMDNFLSEACKDLLLYPTSVKEKQCKQFYHYLDDDDVTKVVKFYRCPNFGISPSCSKAYSNFSSSKCSSCDKFMTVEFHVPEDSSCACAGYTWREGGCCCAETFANPGSFFTMSENLKAKLGSLVFALEILQGLGYEDSTNLQETLVDVSHEEVISLLHCLFYSETPLTDVFLKKHSLFGMSKLPDMSTLSVQAEPDEEEVVSLTVFVSKEDGKILYAESGQDFVELLLTFLVVPLEYVWEITGSNLGCIDNLCESFTRWTRLERSWTRLERSDKCMLPWYYSCQKPLLDVCYSEHDKDLEIASNICKPVDPRSGKIAGYEECSGFLKKGTKFIVSDDLTITPINLSCSLNKSYMETAEEQVINISKTEVITLLRASFFTSTALNTAFGSFLPKKPKEEKL